MITDNELEEMYCTFLDEVYPDLTIAGYSYQTSRALAAVDPTAFRCGFADWISSEIEAGLLVEMTDPETGYTNYYTATSPTL